MNCTICKKKIEIQHGTEVPYKAQLINTLIGVCVDRLKSGKCEASGWGVKRRSGCKEANCKFKPLYINKKLSVAEKKKLKKDLKEFFEKTVKVEPYQPYCSMGTKIYCMECGIKVIRNEV